MRIETTSASCNYDMNKRDTRFILYTATRTPALLLMSTHRTTRLNEIIKYTESPLPVSWSPCRILSERASEGVSYRPRAQVTINDVDRILCRANRSSLFLCSLRHTCLPASLSRKQEDYQSTADKSLAAGQRARAGCPPARIIHGSVRDAYIKTI